MGTGIIGKDLRYSNSRYCGIPLVTFDLKGIRCFIFIFYANVTWRRTNRRFSEFDINDAFTVLSRGDKVASIWLYSDHLGLRELHSKVVTRSPDIGPAVDNQRRFSRTD